METSHEIFYSLDDIRQAALGTEDPNPLHRFGSKGLVSDIAVGGPIVLGFQLATLIDSTIRNLDWSRHHCGEHFGHDYVSSAYDIRYLRPAHSYEIMRVKVKTASSCHQKSGATTKQKSDRILISGDSGSTALGLRKTSSEPINTNNVILLNSLSNGNCINEQMNAIGFYHQDKRIDKHSGLRFLKASMGTKRDKHGANNRTVLNESDSQENNANGRLPCMYPVALSSSVLANSPLFADINLKNTQLVYSRLTLSINNAVSDGIQDGEILNYWVGNAELTVEQIRKGKRKCVIHVVACTALNELVFSGTFSVSLLRCKDAILKSHQHRHAEVGAQRTDGDFVYKR